MSGQEHHQQESAAGEGANGVQRVGDTLRRARVARGKSLEEMGRATHIRTAHLAALEAGDMARLPGRTFVIGFLKLYARHLNLDPERLAEQYVAEVGAPASQIKFNAPRGHGSRPTFWMAVGGVAMLAAGIVLYQKYFPTPHDQPPVPAAAQRQQAVAAAPTLPAQPPAPAVVPAQPEPPLAEEEAVSGAVAPPPEAAAEPVAVHEPPPPPAVVAKPQPAPAAPPASAAPAPAPAPAVAVPAEAVAAVDAPDAASQEAGGGADGAAAVVDGSAAPRVVLVAVERVWVLIKDGDGNTVRERVMPPEERIEVPNRPGLTVDVGNAGGLRFELDGELTPPLGPSARVMRNVSLEPDALRRRWEE